MIIEALALGCIATAAFISGGYLSGRRYWWLGQLAMKEKIRRQVNEKIDSSQIRVLFGDSQPISCEQLFQYICYGEHPSPEDPSRGRNTYKRH